MTDDQIKQIIGVDETMQMLEVREQMKSTMTPELWEQNMSIHKASIQQVMKDLNFKSPIDAADFLVSLLDADTSVDADQKEVWKAVVVIAAFEMHEF